MWKPIKDMVEKNLKEETNLGLITPGGTWDYIFFGKNFKRKLEYFSYGILQDENVISIIKENKLDGLLIKAINDDYKKYILDKNKGVDFKIEQHIISKELNMTAGYFILFLPNNN
jgi:hypothetical protein